MRTEKWWLVLALAVDVGIAALDIAIGRDTTLIGFLIAGPLLASARLDSRHTLLVACYAVAFSVILGWPNDVSGALDQTLRCFVVVTGGGFATLAAHMRTEREEALRRMTRVAEVTQRAILRPIPARIGGMAFATRYQSATQEALIGGDLYDTALTPFGLRVIVGDVKGKGLEAVQLAAAVLDRFREAAFAEPDLVWVARELDARLAGDMRSEDFVTVVLAEFVPGEVRLVNCGHHPPVRVGKKLDKKLEPLLPDVPAPPLGLGPRPILQRVPVGLGDRLLFYTDGLVEARDRRGEMFALDERVRECLTRPTLEGGLDGLLDLVLAHTGGALDDDLALVLGELQPEESRVVVKPVVAKSAERS